MKSNSRFISAAVALAALFTSMVLPAAAAGGAPTGTYTATIGESAATASGGVRGGSGPRGAGPGARARLGRTGGAAASAAEGGSVKMNIASWSTEEDARKLADAQRGGRLEALLEALSGMNHGTVTVGGEEFVINAAFSIQAGSVYHIYLLSAKPFTSAGPAGRIGQGVAVGFISLQVDSSGNGAGQLYTSTQVIVERNGEVRARGGVSTASQLADVKHS